MLSLFRPYRRSACIKPVMKHSVSIVDTAKARRRLAIKNAPLAAVYASRQDNRVTVVCINRHYPGYPDAQHDGTIPFQLTLTFTSASTITLHRMTGNPTDHNIHAENVSHETVSVPVTALQADGTFAINQESGGTEAGMPAAETFIYVFEGTNIGAAGRELSLKEVRDLQPMTFNPTTEQILPWSNIFRLHTAYLKKHPRLMISLGCFYGT